MRTAKVKVYTYAELGPEAQQRARDRHAEIFGFERADEYLDSIKALAAHFGGRVKNYSLDWFGGPSDMAFEMPNDMEEGEVRRRLAELGSCNRRTLKGDGDCKLTGMCYDESAIDGLRRAFLREGERNLNELMQAAYDTWIEAARADCDYDYGEGFAETAEVNGWEYDEAGNTWKGDR